MAILTGSVAAGTTIKSGQGTLELTRTATGAKYKVDLGSELPKGGITLPAAWTGELLGSAFAVDGAATGATTNAPNLDATATEFIEASLIATTGFGGDGTGYILGGIGKLTLWHDETSVVAAQALDNSPSVKKTTVFLANIQEANTSLKVDTNSNGIQVEQGALAFGVPENWTGAEFRGAGVPFDNADTIEAGYGLAVLKGQSDFEKVVKLDEIVYPFVLDTDETLEGIGNSLILGTTA